MAQEKKRRYVAQFGLPEYDAGMITGQKALADFFEEAVALGGAPKEVSNWIMGEVLRTLKEKALEAKQMPLTPATLVKLLELVKQGKINRNTAVEVFAAIWDTDGDPEAYVKEHGLDVYKRQGHRGPGWAGRTSGWPAAWPHQTGRWESGPPWAR